MRWPPAQVAGLVVGALLVAAATPACGSSFTPGATVRREARPLASIYDFIVTVPGIMLPQFPATGLTIDLTLEIDPSSLSTASGAFEGSVTVREVKAGGVSRPFTAVSPLVVTGLASGADWSIESLGPIHVGDASTGFTQMFLSLSGQLSPDGRRIEGIALVTSSGETGTFEAVKQRRYLVASTDFGVTGTVSLIRVRFDTIFTVERDLEAVSGDPVARSSGGGVYVINRFTFDNIQSLDPASGFTTAVQFSTGNGSNPHDAIQVDPNRLYISRYEPPYNDLLIAASATGATLGFIELASLATNASGTPRADGMVMTQGLVFVGLQNVDASFVEYGAGRVAIVDPADDALVASITLEGRNPFGPPAVHPDSGDLYYAMAGVFQGSLPRELSGGIEVVDPRSLTTRGLLVDDDDLGGNVSGVALASARGADQGYCVVTDPSGVNLVRGFDSRTGAVRAGAVYQSASFLPEVVSDGDGYILVPEHDINDPRLIVLDAATGRPLTSVRLSLPPFSIAVLTRGFLRN